MAFKNPTIATYFLLFFLLPSIFTGALLQPAHLNHQSADARVEKLPLKNTLASQQEQSKEGFGRWRMVTSSRRLMIGSRAPICTYNECRGCRFKCTAEQVPVDANDPMNSAYHYRCVCHR